MMMPPSLQLRVGAHLTMTPQLQQAIHLLQLSTVDLRQEIELAVEQNPMLALEDAFDAPDIELDDDWTASETANTEAVDDEFERALLPESMGSTASFGLGEAPDIERNTQLDSLTDVIQRQVHLLDLDEQRALIADTLVDALDGRGYVSESLDTLLSGLNAQIRTPIALETMESVLVQLQQLEPTGIFARSLSECLYLQLCALPSETPHLAQAKRLARQFLDFLAAQDFKRLKRRLNLDDEALEHVIELIRHLDPAPGRAYDTQRDLYVVPDLVLRRHPQHGNIVELNPHALPRVGLQQDYLHLVRRADKSESNQFLKHHLQEARWLLKSLSSRNETLLKVGREIMQRQHDFFIHGEEAMKPLVLADIAEAVDMHESTISRVTTQKFIHTPRGMFELKYFFSSQVGQVGDTHSSTAIRARLRKLIGSEPAHKPLSDAKLVALLADNGITVARRTVAKYREAMGVPASSERKRLR